MEDRPGEHDASPLGLSTVEHQGMFRLKNSSVIVLFNIIFKNSDENGAHQELGMRVMNNRISSSLTSLFPVACSQSLDQVLR